MFDYDGKHLLIDAVCTHDEALLDVEVGKTCLAEVARTIGMTMIMAPVGVQFSHDGAAGVTIPRPFRQPPGPASQASCGYSAFVMLAESHISLHTFPEAHFLTFDCYSCKGFDHALAEACLDRVFGLGERDVQVIAREFPGTRRDRAVINAGETHSTLRLASPRREKRGQA